MTLDEMQSVINRIRYKGWIFHLAACDRDIYLQVRFKEVCSVSGIVNDQRGRKWRLSPHMTTSEIVGTAFKAVITAEEHEVRDHFKYRNEPIFNAHYDVEALVDACNQKCFDIRPEL
jgi:hypothetical protein